MPSVQSKEDEPAEPRIRKEVRNGVNFHTFLAVTQHVITLQSEVMLIKELCKGDTAATARMLSNTSGVVGLLSLFVNQGLGKLSDSTGRKPYLMLGPATNIFLGLLVFNNSSSNRVVVFCRILRMVLTTFSNTVMTSAVLSDVFSGRELAVANSKVGAVVGLGVVSTPFVETFILQRAGHPKYTYLALSVLAGLNLLVNMVSFPESLPPEKRTDLGKSISVSSFSPFGFLKIFTEGSAMLKRIVSITTLQFFLEGKNLSDTVEIWKRSHLKWTIEGSRNFVVSYGVLCSVCGALFTPKLLAACSVKNFTSLTNVTNALGFMIRGSAERSWVFLLALIPMLPGVNGQSAMALKALSSDLATKEGFGKGEFSAWSNNLRALTSSMAPVLFGNYYAWCLQKGIYPGTVFMLAGAVGAFLPEVMLRLTDEKALKGAERSVAKPAAA